MAKQVKVGKSGFLINPSGCFTLHYGSMEPELSINSLYGIDHGEYGEGLYLADNLESAGRWAVSKSFGKDCYIHRYFVETRGLRIFYLNNYLWERYGQYGPSVVCAAWLAFIAKFNTHSGSIKYHENAIKLIEKYYNPIIETADIIIAYRVEDIVLDLAMEIISGNASVSTLNLIKDDLDTTIVLKTEAAMHNCREAEYYGRGIRINIEYDNWIVTHDNKIEKIRNKMNIRLVNELNRGYLIDSIYRYIT